MYGVFNNSVLSSSAGEATKSLGPDKLASEFYHIFKELKPMLLKQFNDLEMEGMLPNSFYKAHIFLIAKSNKDTDTHTYIQTHPKL